jgi:hypothetical protein
MGDYVNKINNSTASLNRIQQTLFDPIVKYNSNLKGRKNFNFYSDKRFKETILEIVDEYLYQKITAHDAQEITQACEEVT